MPLIKSSSEPAFKSNLKAELSAGKPRDQALAIAYDVKRRSKFATGGAPTPWFVKNEARGMMHSGPVMSAVPGRTDKHNISVAAGSYVMPAQAVSHLGQNNTAAGFSALSSMFGANGPYGVKPMGLKRGAGPPKAAAPKPMQMPHMQRMKTSQGGARDGDDTGAPTPIVVAGGEYVLTPNEVMQVGDGNLKHGHEILDAWVNSIKEEHIKTLRKLPGPAKK